MKKFLLLLAFTPLVMMAKDMVILQNGHRFVGEVVKISNRHVLFNIQGDRFRIPASDLAYVGLASLDDTSMPLSSNDVDVCLRAYNDTRLRGRLWNNFFSGVVFGPFAIGYDLLKDYHPLNDKRVMLLSKNKGHFSDPVYLECYNYRAKTTATLQAAAGWATWILFFKN